jgi:hypothetical protein
MLASFSRILAARFSDQFSCGRGIVMQALLVFLIGLKTVGVVAAIARAEERRPTDRDITATADTSDSADWGVRGANFPAEALALLKGPNRALYVEDTGAVAPDLSANSAAAGNSSEREQLFGKGTWSLTLTGSSFENFSGQNVTLRYGTASVGYYFVDNWAFDVHLSGYDLEEDGEPEGIAASFGLNLRAHVLVHDPFSIYLDGGAGLIRADSEFPEGGTNTNFTLQAGLGATWRVYESLHLVGGARWFHISNARRHGEDENASTDGIAIYAGVMWTW